LAKLDSVYKNRVVSSDGVKAKTEYQGIPIHIDRPKGLVMTGKDSEGKEWARQYLYDYGFIPKTHGGDGDELDVFIGPHREAKETYWAIQKKPNGDFDEFKGFIGFSNRDSARSAYRDHIPLKLLDGMVTLRLDLLKAVLGIHPTGQFVKAAMQAVSFTHVLHRLTMGGPAPASPS
jgi:inorganic pyrophosphatase-like protein/inorganic pyrophosphatase